jgi:hypothetical protein
LLAVDRHHDHAQLTHAISAEKIAQWFLHG